MFDFLQKLNDGKCGMFLKIMLNLFWQPLFNKPKRVFKNECNRES